MLQSLQDSNFEQETSQGLTIIDFWAPWCGPCRMQTPILEELSDEWEGQVDFYKMNVDEERKIPQLFGILSIPTLIIKKDGIVVEKLVGLHDKDFLNQIFEKYINE